MRIALLSITLGAISFPCVAFKGPDDDGERFHHDDRKKERKKEGEDRGVPLYEERKERDDEKIRRLSVSLCLFLLP